MILDIPPSFACLLYHIFLPLFGRNAIYSCFIYKLKFLNKKNKLFCYALQPSGQAHQTLIIEEFEPDVFRQLIEYIHTGCVTLQPRTLLGVMNAADYYGLEELRRACAGFVQCCINVDTVCALLASAERYIQYKCTKSLVQKVLEFVDEHGNEVLNLGSFTLLPQHVVRLILAREELRADEFTKFQAALMWSKKYCDNNPVSYFSLFQNTILTRFFRRYVKLGTTCKDFKH